MGFRKYGLERYNALSDSVLLESRAKANHIGIAYAGSGQNQDTGAKVYHLAPNTTSIIKSKSLSKNGGITSIQRTC